MKAKELFYLALNAREKAYCPYSNFAVGAALVADDDTVFTGCNVENAAYGAGICAEQVAFSKAVSAGYKKFKGIAIVGGKKGTIPNNPCYPCGICRQIMSEFCDDNFKVIVFHDQKALIYSFKEILPHPFT